MTTVTTRRGWNLRKVILECPHCGRTMNSCADKTDPPGTVKVVSTCDKCPEDAAIVDYFNAEGKQIDLEGNPL